MDTQDGTYTQVGRTDGALVGRITRTMDEVREPLIPVLERLMTRREVSVRSLASYAKSVITTPSDERAKAPSITNVRDFGELAAHQSLELLILKTTLHGIVPTFLGGKQCTFISIEGIAKSCERLPANLELQSAGVVAFHSLCRDRALTGSDHDLAIMLGKRLLRAVIRDPYGESLQLGTIGGFALLQSNAACDGLASALLESSRRKNKHVPPANPPAMLFGAHVLLTESAAGRHDHDDTVRVVRELRLAHESAGGQSAEIFDELLAWHTN